MATPKFTWKEKVITSDNENVFEIYTIHNDGEEFHYGGYPYGDTNISAPESKLKRFRDNPEVLYAYRVNCTDEIKFFRKIKRQQSMTRIPEYDLEIHT